MTYERAEQLLLSLGNIPRDEYMNDRARLPGYLTRVRNLLDLLGNPEKKVPHYIHVTGTSGKGSVSAYLHSILTAAGQTAGLYTSPHPSHLLERWQIGKKIMTEKEFAGYMETLWPALQTYLRASKHDVPSFFDLCTVIAFMHFAKKKCQWAVIEVGCGGRYDSTNVLPWKDAAVITNIDYDHTEILGRTKTKIAYEKAGIITPGCRVFTMEKNARVRNVIAAECKKNRVELSPISYLLSHINTNFQGTTFVYNDKNYAVRSLGSHQAHNAGLCAHISKSLGISDKAIKKGLATAVQPLRMEIVSRDPLIILDGAHNGDKVRSSVETMRQLGTDNLHLIVGFSNDKNVPELIRLLAELRPATAACARNSTNPFRKTAHPRTLRALFKKYSPKTKTEIFLDPATALTWSKKQLKKQGVLLVTGSIFLSGELRPLFR